jgi:hypothetical protein
LCPYSWRVPKELNGKYLVVPKIEMGPFPVKIIKNSIELRDGKWIQKEKEQL